jgi:NDP-sugar pyrophosphorylase family protein
MKAGIIAAGLGERLVQGGVTLPKPLIPIGGAPLIGRIIEAAAGIHADGIVCIVNDLRPSLHAYLAGTQWPAPLEVIKKTTGSSLESLFQLAPALHAAPFLLFTVDAVFPMTALSRFLRGARSMTTAGGVLALTRFLDDDRPLLVDIARDRRITAIGESVSESPYATAGFYYFRPDIFDYQAAAADRKLGSLRQFLSFLVDQGYPLYGIRVSKTIDVDRAEDVEAAERYVRKLENAAKRDRNPGSLS